MESKDLEEKLVDLLQHWDRVEESIKSAEHLQGYVTIPAINELRYAGRHIIRAISLNGNRTEGDYSNAIATAKQYLTNAEHDVVDATVMFVGKRVAELNLRFGKGGIKKAYPRYEELVAVLESCKNDIAFSRRDNSKRFEIYRNIQAERLPVLLDSYKDLFNADLFMAVEAEKLNFEIKKERLYSTLWKLATVASGIIAALATYLVTILS